MILESYDLPCTDCSNEPLGKIPLTRVIDTLDRDYAKNDLVSAERHLIYWKKEAAMLMDLRSELSICNEIIGLCRRTENRAMAFDAIERAVAIMDKLDLCKTVAAGTVYLNMATTLRHFDETDKALAFYQKTEEVYRLTLPTCSYEYAALYNNKASTLESLERFEESYELLKTALTILDSLSEHYVDKAITYVNLARLFFVWKKDTAASDENLALAWDVLTDPSVKHDAAYAFVCLKASEVFAYFDMSDEAEALLEVAREIYEGA